MPALPFEPPLVGYEPQRAASRLPLGWRPSRTRGQNFLVQPRLADRIVEALEVNAADRVIEIGAGSGVLSERLVRLGPKRLTLVEIDRSLASRLAGRYAGNVSVSVLAGDFLALDIHGLLAQGEAKIIGNLPFNAAAHMLKRLSEFSSRIASMVLMFQREVADRIRARPGTRGYSKLSVLTALYWETDLHFRVAAGSFAPRPKVDAEVLRLKPRALPAFAPEEEQAVIEVVKAAFSAPRKTIRNALTGGLGPGAVEVEAALMRARIDPASRPGTLSVADFVRLARAFGSTCPGPDAI